MKKPMTNAGKNRLRLGAGVFGLLAFAAPVHASDACSPRAIETAASVSVSDGGAFETRSYFQSHENAAFVQIIDGAPRLTAIEGPVSWVRAGERFAAGTDFEKMFALGHQFHAMLLHFDEVMATESDREIEFDNATRRARVGDYPYGGVAYLVQSEAAGEPRGMRFEFPDVPAIDVHFSDWRNVDGRLLPFEMRVDDGSRLFDYSYTEISIENRSPLWYADALGDVSFDEANIYRLHRKLLAAHCLGDADMIAALTAPDTIVADGGAVFEPTREDTRAQFLSLFEQLDYRRYVDLTTPEIEVAESGDIGWITVQVRPAGVTKNDAEPFDDQWAWVMMVRKIDGAWLNAGNASNRLSG
ncbi:MAG: hypothetical protein AAFW81_00285 [Pseudomonadota bacterium]